MKLYTATCDGHTSDEFDNLTNALEWCEQKSYFYGTDGAITLVEEDEDGDVLALDPFTGELL